MDAIPTILVVDDEEAIRDSCRQILERCRYQVETAADGAEGLRLIQRKRVDLVLLDLRMPELDGTAFLQRARERFPDLDVIVITGYSSVGSAVDCMRLGAWDYLPKPFDAESLRLAVRRALEKRRLTLENLDLRRRLRDAGPADLLLGRSPAIRRVQEMIARAAPSESTVLILGESGTGKELVARAVHRASPRRDRAFLTVDCGALAESLCESELFGHVKGAFTGAVAARSGRFELADGGTIFLDEIGHIGPGMQGKLLRVLQEKEITRVGGHEAIHVDVRIIAATNQDLRALMFAGRFREDLFYRLSVVVIEIPPLRTRREDIPILAVELLSRMCERKQLPSRRLSGEAVRLMQIHAWPGNVRELENTLERALLMASGPEIRPEDLYFVDSGGSPRPGRGAGPETASVAGPGTGPGAGLASSPAAGSAADSTLSLVAEPAGGEVHGPGASLLQMDGGEATGAPAAPSPTAAGAEAEDLRLSTADAKHIRHVLEVAGWHLGHAAGLLGIDRKTLWRKIREYHLR